METSSCTATDMSHFPPATIFERATIFKYVRVQHIRLCVYLKRLIDRASHRDRLEERHIAYRLWQFLDVGMQQIDMNDAESQTPESMFAFPKALRDCLIASRQGLRLDAALYRAGDPTVLSLSRIGNRQMMLALIDLTIRDTDRLIELLDEEFSIEDVRAVALMQDF